MPLNPILGAALISSGASFVNNLFGSKNASNMQSQQYEYQRKLNEQQFDLQKQMFDYTSEYNNASNQVQRMKDANLNPNLAYGNGQVAGSTGQTGTIANGTLSAPTHNWQLDMTQLANVGLMNSQSELNKFKAVGEMLRNISEKERSKFAKEFAENALKESNFSTDLMGKTLIEKEVDIRMKEEQIKTEVGRQYNLNAQTMNFIASSVNQYSQADLNYKKIDEVTANIADKYSQITYRDALKIQISYTCDKLSAETANLDERTISQRLHNINDQKYLDSLTDGQLKNTLQHTLKMKQEVQSSKNKFGATDWTGLFNNTENLLQMLPMF